MKYIEGTRADVSRPSRLTLLTVVRASSVGEHTMGEFFLAPLRGLLKLKLYRLVRSLRSRRGAPDLPRAWWLA